MEQGFDNLYESKEIKIIKLFCLHEKYSGQKVFIQQNIEIVCGISLCKKSLYN